MIKHLRDWLVPRREPRTHLNTPPSPILEREDEVQAALRPLVEKLHDIERHSWKVREELAGKVLRIVGD